MAIFDGTGATGVFDGTGVPGDLVSYLSSAASVTIDVTTGGAAGDAVGDSYVEIESYFLTGFADTFTGSALNETIQGIDGADTLDGGAGDDAILAGPTGSTLRGGTGADNVSGGAGNDTFLVAAGEAETGDFINGNGGTDTVQLISGGVGTIFDFTGVTLQNVEVIEFTTSGTLMVSDNAEQAITFGSVAADEIVNIGSWIGGSAIADIFDDLLSYLANGIDKVEWTEDTGDVEAVIDTDFNLVVTYTNNGVVSESFDTRIMTYDGLGALVQSNETSDTGIQVITDYDVLFGPGAEVILTESTADLSLLGDAAPYEAIFKDYALDGFPDGILDYEAEMLDSGLLTEIGYEFGLKAIQTQTDLSPLNDVVNFIIEETFYYADGVTVEAILTLFDDDSTTEIFNDLNGDEVQRINTSPDGTITETVTTDPTGTLPTTREFEGSVGDDVITGDGDDEIYYAEDGADVLDGQGGDDLFVLSDIQSDGTWGALFTYAEQVAIAGGARASAPLSGRNQVTETFLGGAGEDTLQGTNQDEAVLLYESTTLGFNPTVAATDARIADIEVFDMGGGNDVLNLTAKTTQAEYTTDTNIMGGAGDDYLFAGAGNDTIDGGTGLDRIIGWKGDDELTGGGLATEEDRFLFSVDTGGGTDTITDFVTGVDTLFVLGYGVSSFFDATSGGSPVLTVSVGATDTTLTLDDGVTTTDIVLQGVTAAPDAGDFMFLA